MDQGVLFAPKQIQAMERPGDCVVCRVPFQAVTSEGGQIIGWQCPVCQAVSASRMPPLPQGAMECPVCRRSFSSVRRHWAQQRVYQTGGHDAGECERFYRQGMIWSKDRPAWAAGAENA